MTLRIAINGYGRIGRCILRSIFEYQRQEEFDVVAINDLSGIETTAHLTRYDSTHGRFQKQVTVEKNQLIIDEHPITILAERDPLALPWQALDIDVVLECTGRFTERTAALQHLTAGAKKVLISAPGKNCDATIVYGVNHDQLQASHCIVSNASCTIHAYTKDQMLLDGSHSDWHRARSATQSIIPTKTGAASALGLVLPELSGKLDGFAMRVPTLNVSVIDFTFMAKKKTTVAEINDIMRQAQSPILEINDVPLVSIDFNHNKASAIFDTTQTKIIGNLVKVVAWYDNEWGFSNRMLDTASHMMTL